MQQALFCVVSPHAGPTADEATEASERCTMCQVTASLGQSQGPNLGSVSGTPVPSTLDTTSQTARSTQSDKLWKGLSTALAYTACSVNAHG